MFTDDEGNKWEECPIDSRPDHIVIRPVKKTEKKELYHLDFKNVDKEELLNGMDFKFYPTTANKLSEAISALVEYMENYTADKEFDSLIDKAIEAGESFQESQ